MTRSEPGRGAGRAVTEPTRDGGPARRFSRADALVLAVLVACYLATRLVRIAEFPVYFFCDEAVNANLADDLLHNRFRASDGTFPDGTLLPPYFNNDGRIYPSLTVYIHAAAQALLGKSVVETRATSALVSLLGVLAVGLALRSVFRARFWWVGPLLLTVAPIWFLHSRTAFESVMMVSFYGCFVAAYLLYRDRGPGWAPLAVLAAAATFYAHPNGQGIMLASGVLLLALDARYHLRAARTRWRPMAAASVLALLAAVPYARLAAAHPHSTREELVRMGSYVVADRPLGAKLATFGRNYALALSPGYWFAPHREWFTDDVAARPWLGRLGFLAPAQDESETVRHTLKDRGNLPLLALPLILAGLGVTLRRAGASAAHRVVLVALVAAPFTSALVALHQQREMGLLIPAALLACLGLEWIARQAARLVRPGAVAAACAALLAVEGARTTTAALTAGPRWTSNYSLYGVQYGAAEVFAAVDRELALGPDRRCLVSYNWANNVVSFIPFFVPRPDRDRVACFSFDDASMWRAPLDPRALCILAWDELDRLAASAKFVIEPLGVIRYPDGKPGFYLAHLRYIPEIEAVFALERMARVENVADAVTIDGAPATVYHSPFDGGPLAALFDRDRDTLARGAEANPLVLDIAFREPRAVRGASLDLWLHDFTVSAFAVGESGATSPAVSRWFQHGEGQAHADLDLPATEPRSWRVHLEICDETGGAPVHVHVAEVTFR